MAINDLRCDPATVDERLDRPPSLHTEQTEDCQGLSFIGEQGQGHSPDGQLGPGVVLKVGGDGDRSRIKINFPFAPLKINVMSSEIFI